MLCRVYAREWRIINRSQKSVSRIPKIIRPIELSGALKQIWLIGRGNRFNVESNNLNYNNMNKNPRAEHHMVLWSCAMLLAAQLTATAQTLTDRYSFFSATNNAPAAFDLVATNNGTLNGDAIITGGQLQLDGNAWVQLPAGIVTNDLAVTVEAWGDFPPIASQGTWANLFDFGTKDSAGQDSYSISLCVDSGGGNNVIAGISDFDNANVNRQNAVSPGNPLAGLTGAYVAAVFNPPGGYEAVYVNGSLVVKAAITNTITPGVRDLNNWIGWDNWPDPKMVANLDEFRIWNGALNSLEVAASYQNGDANLNTNAGTITGIQLTAGSQLVAGAQEPSTVVATASLITNTVDVTSLATFKSGDTSILTVDTNGVIHAVAGGSTSAIATFAGKSSAQTINVIVTEPAAILTHRYSFTADATDSVGTLNGTLMGTAVISGGQVVLDGTTGCYVDLSTNSFADNGIISGYQSATIDYWATFGTLGNWNYAWAFGNSVNAAGQDYVHNVVRNGNTGHRIDNATSAGGATVDMLGDFANETVHCTTIIDPIAGHLAIYTNGVLSGYASTDSAPLSTVATNLIYIGRSLWTQPGPAGTGDPYVAGSFDELRVYNGTLTPQQIAVADLNGPDNTNDNPGALQSIQVSIAPMQLGDIAAGGLFANYANLTNYDLTANSLTPLLVFTSSDSNVVYQATDGKLHAVGVGGATVTANYQGFKSSQLVSVTHTPVLVNRYSFQDAAGSSTVADSVGGSNWYGTLPNGGTFTGTNLQLSGASDQYVQLPSGILGNYPAVSIDMWVTFPTTLPVNCMLFAFGNTDAGGAGQNYIFCAPQGGRIAITGVDPGYAAEQGCGGAGDLSLRANLHLTAVFDPPAGLETWYTNGVLVSSNTAVTVPMAYVQSVLNYIGHSIYTADPHEDSDLIEFRIYNGALLPADVAASEATGPSSVPSTVSLSVSASGPNVLISWPVSATGFSLYSSPTPGPGAAWTPATGTLLIVGQNYQISIPTTGNKAQFYELKK